MVTADGEREIRKASKEEVAAAVLDVVEEMRPVGAQA